MSEGKASKATLNLAAIKKAVCDGIDCLAGELAKIDPLDSDTEAHLDIHVSLYGIPLLEVLTRLSHHNVIARTFAFEGVLAVDASEAQSEEPPTLSPGPAFDIANILSNVSPRSAPRSDEKRIGGEGSPFAVMHSQRVKGFKGVEP